MRRAAAPIRQERLEVSRIRKGDRHEDRRRDRCGARVVLEHEARHDLIGCRLAGRLQQEDVAADELAASHHEDLDRGLTVLPGEAQDILLGSGEGGHLLRLHRPLDRSDLVAEDRRPLVLEVRRRHGHVTFQ